jgi:hypothetical protein
MIPKPHAEKLVCDAEVGCTEAYCCEMPTTAKEVFGQVLVEEPPCTTLAVPDVDVNSSSTTSAVPDVDVNSSSTIMAVPNLNASSAVFSAAASSPTFLMQRSYTYSSYGPGYPDQCHSDFIRYQRNVWSLHQCQAECSSESECQYVAWSSTGERGCGLYKSACEGQTHTACDVKNECFWTYHKKFPTCVWNNGNCGGLLQKDKDCCDANAACVWAGWTAVKQCLTTTTTTTTILPSTWYSQYGAGYPGPNCFADYIRHEVNVRSKQACLNKCTADFGCNFVAYNFAANGDHRCGLYRSTCQHQVHTACQNTECYITFQKQHW